MAISTVATSCDPDGARAEFAILVRSDMQGRGLGGLLMDKIVRYCRTRGIGEVVGDVLATNVAVRMLALAREIGFEKVASDEPSVVRISLACQAPTISKAADYA